MGLMRYLRSRLPRLPWQNPWGERGRPPMPEAHDLANRLTAIQLRRDLISRQDLETWEGMARWDAYAKADERT